MSELRERELRDLLERVSAIDGDIDVDEHWTAGRRRRTRRGAGIAVVTGVLAVAAAGAVAQTGLLGGSGTTPTAPTAGPPTGVAAVPDDLETFVFARPDATGSLDETVELDSPSADDLAGTQWVLQRGMWNTRAVATDLTGSTAPTTLIFADEAAGGGWRIDVGGCGSASIESLQLDGRGRFTNPGVGSDDQGCPEDVQAAEDFWRDSLSGGGQLTLLEGGQWLLLSVETPAQPTPSPTTGPAPTPTTEPDEGEDATDDDGSAAPTVGTITPTGEDTGAPTDEGEGATDEGATDEGAAGPTHDGEAAPTDGGTAGPGTGSPAPPTTDPDAGTPPPPVAQPPAEPFLGAGQESVDQPWPGGGGELLAPTVRAGVHDGFDRVVVDLTGTGDLGWRASYTDDPRLDGSGQPSSIAGDSVLELSLSGMAYPEPGSDVYAEGVFGLDTHTLGAVVEVQRTAPFEGMLQVFVGMQGEPRPYRVYLLDDPMRLVIDVQTST